MLPVANIDISESILRRHGTLLDALLFDRTTGKNILWGTDSYASRGEAFAPAKRMQPELLTGVYGKLIQPRAIKSREEQLQRTKDKAEVFTPLRIVHEMNSLVDQAAGENIMSGHTWSDYVAELRLEIACGEAPFIVSRYNPVAHGALIKLENRVGFLDHKLRVVSHYCHKPKEWLIWAKIAFQSSYGYEWQGDNLLIARENLLYTLVDYYKAAFGRSPSLQVQQEFAEIISWNIFQMDGIKYVVPMSCHHETRIISGELTLFGETPDTLEKYECEGCKFNRPAKHNGKYVKLMDWTTGKRVNFLDIVTELDPQSKSLCQM
jgi:hypothetical protein